MKRRWCVALACGIALSPVVPIGLAYLVISANQAATAAREAREMEIEASSTYGVCPGCGTRFRMVGTANLTFQQRLAVRRTCPMCGAIVDVYTLQFLEAKRNSK